MNKIILDIIFTHKFKMLLLRGGLSLKNICIERKLIPVFKIGCSNFSVNQGRLFYRLLQGGRFKSVGEKKRHLVQL